MDFVIAWSREVSVAFGGRAYRDALVRPHGHLHAPYSIAAQLRCHRIRWPRRADAEIAVRMIEGISTGLLDRLLCRHRPCNRRRKNQRCAEKRDSGV